MRRVLDTFKDKIQSEITKVEKILQTRVVDYQQIFAKELIRYFDAPAPSGDITILSDILDSR